MTKDMWEALSLGFKSIGNEGMRGKAQKAMVDVCPQVIALAEKAEKTCSAQLKFKGPVGKVREEKVHACKGIEQLSSSKP